MYIVLFENHDEPISYKEISEIAEGCLCSEDGTLESDVIGCVSVHNDQTTYFDKEELQQLIYELESFDAKAEYGTY